MDDITTSTVVSSEAPVATGAESNAPAAPSVSQEGDAAPSPIAGSVTAGEGATGTGQEQEGTAPPPSEDDPLEGIPSIDELRQQAEQKVPYAEGLLRLRTALEARKEQYEQLKTQHDPLAPVLEKYGDPAAVQQRLETLDSLFSPVINPQTNQPEYENGLPKYTTAPFIERADADNPGLAEQMLVDLLSYAPAAADGQKAPPMWQQLFESWGLDPKRLDDYRNIDALQPQPTGDISPDELQDVPEEFREVYKSLPPGVRSDLQAQDEETRRFHLEAHKERFDRKASETLAREQAEQAAQQQRAEIQAYVAREQEAYVSQARQEGVAAILDEVARQVTFGDAETDSAVRGIAGGFLVSLLDPDFRSVAEPALNAWGVKLDPSFDEALNAASAALAQYKALELAGQTARAQQALAAARGPKMQVQAKAAQIAQKLYKAFGAQARKAGEQANQSLSQAAGARPTPTDGEAAGNGNGLLPEGMLANDPRAGLYLARQTGLLGG